MKTLKIDIGLTYLTHTPLRCTYPWWHLCCNLINQFILDRQVSRYATSPVADRICSDQMTDTTMTLLNVKKLELSILSKPGYSTWPGFHHSCNPKAKQANLIESWCIAHWPSWEVIFCCHHNLLSNTVSKCVVLRIHCVSTLEMVASAKLSKFWQ